MNKIDPKNLGRYTTFVVVSHLKPHPDEIGFFVILVWVLSKLKPGLKFRFELYDPSKVALYKKTDGDTCYVLAGVGGGHYDEHPKNGSKEKARSSSTILVNDLACIDMPGMRKLLAYIEWHDSADWKRADNEAKFTEMDPWMRLKRLYEMDSSVDGQIAAAMRFADDCRDMLVHGAMRVDTIKDLKAKGGIEISLSKTVSVPVKGEMRRVRVGLIHTKNQVEDNSVNNLDVKICCRPDGSVLIYRRRGLENLCLVGIVMKLRAAEYKKKHGYSPTSELVEMSGCRGNCELLPGWNYFFEEQAIFNRGDSHNEEEVTLLRPVEIFDMAVEGILLLGRPVPKVKSKA